MLDLRCSEFVGLFVEEISSKCKADLIQTDTPGSLQDYKPDLLLKLWIRAFFFFFLQQLKSNMCHFTCIHTTCLDVLRRLSQHASLPRCKLGRVCLLQATCRKGRASCLQCGCDYGEESACYSPCWLPPYQPAWVTCAGTCKLPVLVACKENRCSTWHHGQTDQTVTSRGWDLFWSAN